MEFEGIELHILELCNGFELARIDSNVLCPIYNPGAGISNELALVEHYKYNESNNSQ